MNKLFGTIGTSGDCKGIMGPGCKGIITTSGDCFGVMFPGCRGIVYPY